MGRIGVIAGWLPGMIHSLLMSDRKRKRVLVWNQPVGVTNGPEPEMRGTASGETDYTPQN